MKKTTFMAVIATIAISLSVVAIIADSSNVEGEASIFVDDASNLSNISSGTYVLNEDISCDIVIGTEATVTLDLNGHKITNISDHTIINHGTLTIIDSSSAKTGTVNNITHEKAALFNDWEGIAILNGGIFDRSLENGKNEAESGGNSFYTIRNYGMMTINDDTVVTQNGKYSSMIQNGYYDGSTKNKEADTPTMIINGGTFTGGLNTVKNDDYGILTINDGVFKNVAQAAVLNWNKTTINGGYFNAKDADDSVILNGKINDTMDCGILIINEGSFYGKTGIKIMDYRKSLGSVTITGGYFDTTNDLIYGKDSAANVVISGGNYNKEITTDIKEGYACGKLNDRFIIGVEATSSNGTVTSESESIIVSDVKNTSLNASLNGGSSKINISVTGDAGTLTMIISNPETTELGTAFFIEIGLGNANAKYTAEITVPVTVPNGMGAIVKSYDDEGNFLEEHRVISTNNDGVTFETTHTTIFVVSFESEPVVTPDDDDELPFIPGQNDSPKDDSSTYVAVAAAAAVVAILAVLVVGISKGKL